MPLGQNKRKIFSQNRSLLVLLLFGLLLCVVNPAQRSRFPFVGAFSCQAGGRYILPGPYVITNDWISNPGCTVEGRGDPGVPNYNTYITFLIGIGPRASFPSSTGWHGVRNVYLNRSFFINVQLVFNTTWLHGGDLSTIDSPESPPFTLTIVGCTFRADRYAWSWLVNFDGPFLGDRSSIEVRNNTFTLMTLSSYVGFFSVFDLQTRQFYSNVSALFKDNTVFWQSSIWNSNSFLMFLSMGVSSPTSSVVSEDWYDCVAKKNPIVFAGGSSLTFNNIRLDLKASLYSENYVGATITSDILLLNSPLRAFGARNISVNHTRRCSNRYVVENDSNSVGLSNPGRWKYAETDTPKLKFPTEANFISFINCSIDYQGTSPSQTFSNFELFRAFEAVNLFGNALLTLENNLIRCKDVNTVSLLAVSDLALFDASGTIVENNDLTNTQNAKGRIPFGSRLSVQSLYISGSLTLDGFATAFLSDVLFLADNSPNFLATTVKDDVPPLLCASFLIIAKNRVSLEMPYSEVGPFESIATLLQIRPFQKSEVKIINGSLIHVKANLLIAVIGTVPDGDVLVFRGFVLLNAGTSVTLLEKGLLLLDSQNELQFNSTRVSNETLGSPIFISAISMLSDKAHDTDALTIIDANRAASPDGRTRRIASWPIQSLCQGKYVHGGTHGTIVKVNVSKLNTSVQEQRMLLNANITGIYVADQLINAFAMGSKAMTASIVTVSAGMIISGRGSCIGLEASAVNAVARIPKGISESALEATLDARGIDFGYVGSSKSAVFANFSVLTVSGLRLRRSTNIVATNKHSYSQLIGFRFGMRLDITNFSLLAVVGNQLETRFVTADNPAPSLTTENSVVFFCSVVNVRLLDHATIFIEENSIFVAPSPIRAMSSKTVIAARAGNIFLLEFGPENLGTLLIEPNSSILIWRNKVDVVDVRVEALHFLVATRIRFYYNPKSMFDLFKITRGKAALQNASDRLLFEPLVGFGSSSISEIFADRRAISIKGNEISARADEGKMIPAVSINAVYVYPTPKYVSLEDMLRTPSAPRGQGDETDLIYVMMPPNLWNLRYLFNNHNREAFVAFISLCRNVINDQRSELVYPPVWRNANWDGGGKAEASPGIDSLADPMDVSATGIDCNTKTISKTQMETLSSTITITRKTESSKHTATLEHTGSHLTGTNSIEPAGKTLSSSLSGEVCPTDSIPLTLTRFLTKTLSLPDGCPTHCDNITLASHNTSTGSPLSPNFCSDKELGEVRHNEWREEGAVSKAARLLYNSARDDQVVYTENWENTSAKTASMFDVAYINLRWEGGHPPLKTSVSSSDGTKPSVGLFAFKPRIGGVELFLVKPLRSLDDQFVAVQVDVFLEFACPNRSSGSAAMGSAIKIHVTLLPPPKPPSLSPGAWDAVSAVSILSLAAGIASDVFGVTVVAPAAGIDLQTLALIGISRCTKQNVDASNLWELGRTSGFGTPYRALSPFAAENTFIGIAMGNAILLLVVFLINGGVALVHYLLNKEKISRLVESRRALVVSSMEFGKFPSVTLLCALHLQNGFIISGLELGSQQRVSGAFCLFWLLVPLVSHFFIMAFLSTRAFYPWVTRFGGNNPGTAWKNVCQFLAHIVFPTGCLDPKEVGSLMFSSVLQPFRVPNRSMFICSFMAFFASAPLSLPLADYEKCTTIFTASTLLHAAFAVALAIVRPFRSRFENWASALSMLTNGTIVLLASFAARKSNDGTQKILGEPNKVLLQSLSTLVNLQIAIGIAKLLIHVLRMWLNSPACWKFSPFHINVLTLSCSWEAVGWWPLSALVSYPEPLFLGETPGHHTDFATHFDESEISLEHHGHRSVNPKHAKQDHLRALLGDESVELGTVDQ